MVLSKFSRKRISRPQAEVAQFPIPTKGVNTFEPISRLSADYLIYGYNIYSGEKGPTTRPGHKTYSSGFGNPVRSIIPLHASTESGGSDKLFCATQSGIYDITTPTQAPVLVEAFISTSGNAGWGNFIQTRNDAGDSRLLFADQQNGLFLYTPGTNLWDPAPGITGLTVSSVRFVMQHKLRVWLIVADSPVAYYLPVGAFAGAVVAFNFAGQFPHGGYCVGAWSWTVDGGAGADDLFVVVSSSGDVLVYQGIDPSASTWSLIGKWYIGALPNSRNIAFHIGSELHLLSRSGVTSVNDLLRGVYTERLTGQASISRNIVSLIRDDMRTRSNNTGWGVFHIASLGLTGMFRPLLTDSDTPIQYVFNLTSPSWGLFRGLPAQCGGEFQNGFYFGTRTGTVELLTGGLDNVTFTGTGGSAVEFSMLTGYSDMGSPARNKVGTFVRADFQTPRGLSPTYGARIVYDFHVGEPSISLQGSALAGESKWDSAVWDRSLWGGADATRSILYGASGIGRYLAVALKGTAQNPCILNNLEVAWVQGKGFL